VILCIHASKSAKEAEKYFTGKRAQQEASYYTRDGQEFAGYWYGKGAEKLGLAGKKVMDEAFVSLLNNQHPVLGDQITPRMRDDRRPGFDLTFNAPKSVSLVYARTKDDRIIQAFRQMHLDVIAEMESDAATRVRLNGQKDGYRFTGNLVWGENIHLTARPVGGIPDPHLHSHCYVLNMTFDGVEDRWKALEMRRICDEADYYNRVAVKRLAENLQRLGLEIVFTKDSLEIVGVSKELRDKFSKRTKTIEEYAAVHGVTDPEQKAKIAVLTREKKAKNMLLSDMEPFWWASLTPEEAQALDRIGEQLRRSQAAELSQTLLGEPGKGTAKITVERSALLLGQKDGTWAERNAGKRKSLNQATRPSPSVEETVTATEHDYRAVALGIEHVFERQSVVTDKQLMAEALNSFCVGKATLAGIRQAVKEAPLLRREQDGKLFVTTERVLAEEKCLAGKGRHEAMNEFWRIEDEKLNDQQRGAVMHVLNSKDWITGIAGRAGTGKTTLLHEVRRGIQSGMHKLIALAPTSEAARDVLRKEGFDNAETVAKLLRSERLQNEARGAVWLVDEAGLLSARDADKLLDLAEKLEARLVFVGDPQQHHPVQRGQAFDHLRKEGGMEVAEVTKILRQKGIHKRFVEQVIAEDIPGAMKTLKELEWAFEMTLEERKIALARDYLAAIERGETALVVAPTHAECADVTEGIRDALKAKNVLKGGVEWDVLRNLSWSDAQKMDSDQYKNKKGLVVQINGHVAGFALGEQVEVIYEKKSPDQIADDGMVRVRCKDGYNMNIRALPLSEPDSFAVYERAKMEICEGEKLRITGNGYSADKHRLNNRKTYKVDYISHDGRIVLENGWKIDREFKHLNHGYANTSHGAQGQTVDWVFLAMSAQFSSCASDLRQFYVSMTRGRKGSKLYGDDLELVEEIVSRRRERPMATEILQETDAERAAEFCPENSEAVEIKISESLGKADAAELEIKPELREAMDKALYMAYPISEQEAAEAVRQMEAAEVEPELEMEMEM